MIKKTTILLASSLLMAMGTQAQEITKTITHPISKKAAKVGLFDYTVDKENNQIEFAYKLKDVKKKMVMETYKFKLDDLSFISAKEEEFFKEKVKYKRVRGSSKKPYKLLKITNNVLNGKMKLHKGHLSFWYAGRALLSKFVEEQTKEVTTSQGDRFVYMNHHTEMNDLTGHMAWGHVSLGIGNVSVIGMERTKPYYSKYGFAIYDAHTLKEKLYQTFDLKKSYIPMSIKYLPNGDYGIIFKPFETINLVNLKKDEKFNRDPENNFKYIQINTKGEKVVDVNFKLPITKAKGNYNIQIIPTDKKGEIVLLGMFNKDMFGAAVQIKAKWIGIQNVGEGIEMYRAKKAKGLVIKIADNKISYQKEFDLSKLKENQQLTEGTKSIDNPMQSFKPSAITTDKEGNILIGGMNKYHTIIQIDKEGNFTTYLDASNQDLVVYNQFFKNAKDELFWINTDQVKVKGDGAASDIEKAQNQRTAVISKINSVGRKIDKTISLTTKGAFLDKDEPIKVINDDELLIYAHDKKKSIILSKLLLK